MHLSYCTNVHPAEDLDGVLHQLDAFAGPVRRAAGFAELGVGLWLPADLAAQLAAAPTTGPACANGSTRTGSRCARSTRSPTGRSTPTS